MAQTTLLQLCSLCQGKKNISQKAPVQSSTAAKAVLHWQRFDRQPTPETLSSTQERVAESHLAAAAALAAELRHGFKDSAWGKRCASGLTNGSG